MAECINVFKVKTKIKSTGFATVGDEIGVVINRARPIALASSSSVGGASSASNIQKVRKGDMRRAVVVRTRKTELRPDGRYVKSVLLFFSCRSHRQPMWGRTRSLTPMTRFDDTACVLLNAKSEMIGTRVNGPVSSELRDIPGGAGGPAGRWSKILSLAPKACLSIVKDCAAVLTAPSDHLDEQSERILLGHQQYQHQHCTTLHHDTSSCIIMTLSSTVSSGSLLSTILYTQQALIISMGDIHPPAS